jgi:hypothetical protein
MASPKSGTAGTAVVPADPDVAAVADDATPGTVETVQATAAQTKAGQYGVVKVKPFKPPKTKAEKKKKKSWIEVVLVDEHKNPVAGEAYRITLPDGQTVAEGTLDDKGFVRIEGIDPGTCQVTFPDIDATEWRRE